MSRRSMRAVRLFVRATLPWNLVHRRPRHAVDGADRSRWRPRALPRSAFLPPSRSHWSAVKKKTRPSDRQKPAALADEPADLVDQATTRSNPPAGPTSTDRRADRIDRGSADAGPAHAPPAPAPHQRSATAQPDGRHRRRVARPGCDDRTAAPSNCAAATCGPTSFRPRRRASLRLRFRSLRQHEQLQRSAAGGGQGRVAR